MQYPTVQCFLLTPANKVEQSFRRYARSNENSCPINGYHNASVVIGVCDVSNMSTEERDSIETSRQTRLDKTDPRWPTKCGCGYEFVDTDEWQYHPHQLYSCSDGGPDCTTGKARPGAIWDATWNHDVQDWCGIDGKSYVCKLPNGRDWMIDGRASNCTMPKDRVHKCWCRHGEAPMFTVNKTGNTCQAGGGSILSGDYHGFLTNGQLLSC